MKVDIKCIFVGKNKDRFIDEGVKKYSKFLKKFGKIEIIESKCSNLTKESAFIEKSLRNNSFKIFLDVAGEEFTTLKFTEKIQNIIDNGINKFDFVIGGAFGFETTILKKADLKWSLSKLTFNHQIVRIVLLEQIYRIFSIINGEKYHH